MRRAESANKGVGIRLKEKAGGGGEFLCLSVSLPVAFPQLPKIANPTYMASTI